MSRLQRFASCGDWSSAGVDILQQIDGITFAEAWESCEECLIDDEVMARYISADDLITNKLASGRPGRIRGCGGDSAGKGGAGAEGGLVMRALARWRGR